MTRTNLLSAPIITNDRQTLAWVMQRPQVTSVLNGATRREQLDLNPSALDLQLPLELVGRLTDASQPDSTELDHFFEPTIQAMIHGGVHVARGVPRT